MIEQKDHDQKLLLDYLLNRCDDSGRQEVEQRLADDQDFAALKRDIANTLDTLDTLPAYEPQQDLAERAMQRIRSHRKTEALLARQESVQRMGRRIFSFRELGTVAAAAILLAVVFVPWARQARRLSMANQCAANIGQIGAAMGSFAAANNDELPSNPHSQIFWLPQNGNPVTSNSSNLFQLVRQGYAPAAVFVCPSDHQAQHQRLIVTQDMQDFPAAAYISYSYQHTLGPKRLSWRIESLAGAAGAMAVLSDRTPLFNEQQFLRERLNQLSSDNHAQQGHNVLYFDRHVKWQNTPDVGVDADNIYLIQGVRDYQGKEAPDSDTDTFLLPAWSGRSE